MPARAVILGCRGPALDPWERRFFREADPWGFILFGRNIGSPEEVRALTAALRESVGREAPVLIDQEGGRVARLTPPVWRGWPDAGAECAALPDLEARCRAMAQRYRVIAGELAALGIDVNCAPVLDVGGPGTHPFLRSRVYDDEPEAVAAIGRAVADGLLAGGVLPVIKHVPGHGRAGEDSHRALPRIEAPLDALEASDFVPFRRLADLPMAMTAHVVMTALDPEAPVTLSAAGIAAVRGAIGFGGLLMTDDISMGALAGPVAERAGRALAAGCDLVLHCNGVLEEMEALAGTVPLLAGEAAARAGRALGWRRGAGGDVAAAEREALRRGAAHA